MVVSPYPVWRTTARAQRAYIALYLSFILIPIVAGVDKFFMALTNWNQYLAPAIPDMLNLSRTQFMQIVGGVEIVAGLLVMVAPRIGGYVVMFWLWGIIVNLFMRGGYYDVALRDFGLSMGAMAMASLAGADRKALD